MACSSSQSLSLPEVRAWRFPELGHLPCNPRTPSARPRSLSKTPLLLVLPGRGKSAERQPMMHRPNQHMMLQKRRQGASPHSATAGDSTVRIIIENMRHGESCLDKFTMVPEHMEPMRHSLWIPRRSQSISYSWNSWWFMIVMQCIPLFVRILASQPRFFLVKVCTQRQTLHFCWSAELASTRWYEHEQHLVSRFWFIFNNIATE